MGCEREASKKDSITPGLSQVEQSARCAGRLHQRLDRVQDYLIPEQPPSLHNRGPFTREAEVAIRYREYAAFWL